MTTWAEHLARRDRQWLLWVTVESLGDGDGLWRLSSAAGWTLGEAEGTWCPWLVQLPDILSVRVPFFEGGAIESQSGIELEVVDVEGRLTDLLQLERPASCRLTSSLSPGGTVLSVDALPAEFAALTLANGDMLWLGSEAVRIVSRGTSPDVITVTRGELGTVATEHLVGSGVHVRPRWLEGRELRAYMAPLDGAESEAQLVGVYTLADLSLDEAHASWSLGADAREPYLDRQIPRAPIEAVVRGSGEAGDTFAVVAEASRAEVKLGGGGTVVYGSTDLDELLAYSQYGPTALRAAPYLHGRQHAESPRDDLPAFGARLVRVLTVANGDFRATNQANRNQPRNNTPSWPVVDTWVEVMLCIMLSPVVPGDAATNYDPSTGTTGWQRRNWSGLPSGYGSAIPWQDVNFESFERVAASSANFRIPYFQLGPEPQTLSEVLTPLLRVAGAFLVRERGQLRLVAPELPLAGDAPTYSVDTSTVLRRPGQSVPALQTSRTRTQVTEVRLTVGPEGREVVQSWADAPRLFDPRDLFVLDGRSLKLEAPFLDPADESTSRRLAFRHLVRGYRPLEQLDAELDAQLADWSLGESCAVDLPGVPDFIGRRGLVGVGQLGEVELTAIRGRGVWLVATIYVQPAARVGRISASADVTAVAGPGPSALESPNSNTAYLSGANDAIYRWSGSVSVACWVRPAASGGSALIAALGQSAQGTGDGWAFTRSSTLQFASDGTFDSVSGLVAGAWQHLGVTYDGTDLQFYRNGAALGSPITIALPDPTSTTSPFYVFRTPTSASGASNERRMYLAAWNGTALDAGDMAALYNSGVPVRPDEATGVPSPSYFYPLDNLTTGLVDAMGAAPTLSATGTLTVEDGPVPGSPDVEATVAANVYTSTDAGAGLPTTDAAAFTEDDVVRLVDANGVDIGGGTETVDGVAGSVLTLSGDFGGALAVGTTIIYADATEGTVRQSTRYVYLDRGWVYS